MKQKKNSLLWEIKSELYPSNTYLFGTMHVKSNRVFSAFDQISKYIASCDSFCVEIDLVDAQSTAMQNALLAGPDQSLTNILSQKEYTKLASIFQSLGVLDIHPFQKLRPMHLINLLSSLLMKEDTHEILDLSLYRYAKGRGMRTFGIETQKEHLTILNNMDRDAEVKHLKRIIRNFPAFAKQHAKLLDYYTQGRIDKLYLHGKKSLGKWRKVLLKDRNYIISSRLHDIAKQEAVFCAIGAGHLYGKYGVLRLLKLNGATIRPISLNYF